jgi:transcriptional regulator with XRE-family HTH domain
MFRAIVLAMGAPLKLREWRASRSLSQTEAARLLGVTQSSWSAWETGRKRPELEAVVALERVTKRAVRLRDWLLRDEDHEATVAAVAGAGKA